MKKLVMLLAVLLAVSGTAYASASKPAVPDSPCISDCKAKFGNPFKPNHPYEVEARTYALNPDGTLRTNYKIDSRTGQFVELAVCTVPRKQCLGWMGFHDCACYDPAKPTYEPNAYNACSKGC